MDNDEIYDPIIYNTLSPEEIRNEFTFFVTLSNGQRAFHKHGKHSWLQIKSFLKENPDIFIENFYFQFRDNIVHIGGGEVEGFFFSWGAEALLGSDGHVSPTKQMAIGGIIKDGILRTQKYLVPDLILSSEENYSPMDSLMQRGLIRRNGKKI